MPPDRLHRLYATVLILLGGAAALGFGLFGRSLEPLTGDLTRIGWYAENDFGWTLPQLRFDPLAAAVGARGGRYDIVALGDSFTAEAAHNPGTTWPHFLARDTGLTVGIFDSGIDSLERLLASPAWRQHPPAILVYEVVERRLVPQHGGASTSPESCAANLPTPAAGIALRPLAVAPATVERRRQWRWDEWPASYGMEYLWHNFWRRLHGSETTAAVPLELTTGGLFSSRADRRLLVYGDDFNKMGWQPADWRAALCDIARLQDRVQANGHTAFFVMVIPDKLSVYTPFLPYRDFDRLSHLERLDEVPGVNWVRVDRSLDPRARIDLYLPNDTHWAPRTQEMAAAMVRDALLAAGVLRP
jgi:hypothetical protein